MWKFIFKVSLNFHQVPVFEHPSNHADARDGSKSLGFPFPTTSSDLWNNAETLEEDVEEEIIYNFEFDLDSDK